MLFQSIFSGGTDAETGQFNKMYYFVAGSPGNGDLYREDLTFTAVD